MLIVILTLSWWVAAEGGVVENEELVKALDEVEWAMHRSASALQAGGEAEEGKRSLVSGPEQPRKKRFVPTLT
jgi:hypothetical protein